MQYQKITNLLDNTQNQPTILKTIHWIKLNDDPREHVIKIVKSNLKLRC